MWYGLNCHYVRLSDEIYFLKGQNGWEAVISHE